MFETYPDIQKLFWPKYSELTAGELQRSEDLKIHANNIMHVIDLVLRCVIR